MKSRTIRVDYLARVEGEGALHVKVKNGAVEDVRLEIFEPPRFFEALLRGRDFTEAPDITARICGICPIAYLLGASRAMEDAWEGVAAAVVVDALSSGAPAGTIARFDASTRPLPRHLAANCSTHDLGLGDAIEVARALSRLPDRLIVIGIEGGDFSQGRGLSRAVEGAVERAVEAVSMEIARLATPGLRRGEAEHA